jgi:hypothetical protein
MDHLGMPWNTRGGRSNNKGWGPAKKGPGGVAKKGPGGVAEKGLGSMLKEVGHRKITSENNIKKQRQKTTARSNEYRGGGPGGVSRTMREIAKTGVEEPGGFTGATREIAKTTPEKGWRTL